MSSIAYFVLAAFFEIAGCFSFWTWLRHGRAWWVLFPGVASLVLFALCLTQVEAGYAGRAHAPSGGIYIASSLAWLRAVEGITPDRWDLVSAGVCVLGALIVLFGPR